MIRSPTSAVGGRTLQGGSGSGASRAVPRPDQWEIDFEEGGYQETGKNEKDPNRKYERK